MTLQPACSHARGADIVSPSHRSRLCFSCERHRRDRANIGPRRPGLLGSLGMAQRSPRAPVHFGQTDRHQGCIVRSACPPDGAAAAATSASRPARGHRRNWDTHILGAHNPSQLPSRDVRVEESLEAASWRQDAGGWELGCTDACRALDAGHLASAQCRPPRCGRQREHSHPGRCRVYRMRARGRQPGWCHHVEFPWYLTCISTPYLPSVPLQPPHDPASWCLKPFPAITLQGGPTTGYQVPLPAQRQRNSGVITALHNGAPDMCWSSVGGKVATVKANRDPGSCVGASSLRYTPVHKSRYRLPTRRRRQEPAKLRFGSPQSHVVRCICQECRTSVMVEGGIWPKALAICEQGSENPVRFAGSARSPEEARTGSIHGASHNRSNKRRHPRQPRTIFSRLEALLQRAWCRGRA